MEGKYIPNIRHSGFTESWEKVSLFELMTFSNGINAPKENYGIGRKMISVMDILDDGPIVYEKIRNSVQVEDKTEQKNKVEDGDLVFVRSSETVDEVGIAKAYREKDYALFSGFTIRGKKKNNFDAKFIELSLNNSNRKQIERKAGGSTRFNVSQFLLNSIEIFQPSIEEQKEVGKFFDELESMISLHQQELTTLKQAKQGFLQKMFPKEGASTPEIRFPGFTEEWNKSKLGKLASVTTGKLDANAMKEGGKYDFYTSGIKKYKIDIPAFNGPAITIAGNGATVGYMHLADNKFNAYQRTYVLSDFKADRGFLFLEIGKKLPKKIDKQARKGNIPYIVMDMLTNLDVSLPSLEEQQTIGDFFKQLDEVIDLHQQELKILKQTKQAFLQKMFV